MTPSLVVTIGLLVQAAGNPQPAPVLRGSDPIRVWRADSTVYVTVREPGHVLILHVDAIGRIRVLFPLAPDDSTAIAAGTALAVAVPPAAQGYPATLVAVGSRWPFEFAALRAAGGSTWNYYGAFLLQPTAGDPLGALLDIADRVTDGRPYDSGAASYSRDGTIVARGPPVPPQVCWSCIRRGTPVAAAPTPAPTNTVDCSNASLTNSFCGVASGPVSITSVPAVQQTYQPAPQPAPALVYVLSVQPVIVHGARPRFERPMPPPAPAPRPSVGAAFPIAPRLIVPSSAELPTLTRRRP